MMVDPGLFNLLFGASLGMIIGTGVGLLWNIHIVDRDKEDKDDNNSGR